MKRHQKKSPLFSELPLIFLAEVWVFMKILCKWNSKQTKWTVIFIPMTKMRNHDNRYMITHLTQMNAQRVVCKANMCTAYYIFSWNIFYSDKNRLDIAKKNGSNLFFKFSLRNSLEGAIHKLCVFNFHPQSLQEVNQIDN